MSRKSLLRWAVACLMSCGLGPVQAQDDGALFLAIDSDDVAAVERLLANGVDPDPAAPESGQSPLEHSCGRIFGLASLAYGLEGDALREALGNQRAIIGLLLEAGADPDANVQRDTLSYSGGQTPMMAGGFAPDCVEPLLRAGANPNAQLASDLWGDGNGLSVLHAGVGSGFHHGGGVMGLALVLNAGADAMAVRHDGLTLKAALAETFESMMPYAVTSGGAIKAGEVEYLKFNIHAYRVLHGAGVRDALADVQMHEIANRLYNAIEAAPMTLGEVSAEASNQLASVMAERVADGDAFDAGQRELVEDAISIMPLREVLRTFLENGA